MTGSNFEEILQKPAFNALEPERKIMFVELARRLQNKGNMEAFGILMEFMKTSPKGKEIGKAEQNAMIEAFMQSMTDGDRSRFQSILKMIQK